MVLNISAFVEGLNGNGSVNGADFLRIYGRKELVPWECRDQIFDFLHKLTDRSLADECGG